MTDPTPPPPPESPPESSPENPAISSSEDAPESAPNETNAPNTTEASAASPSPALSESLLDILVCPLTRSKLYQDGDHLVANRPEAAGLRYPIRDGIPVLLVDSAAMPDGVADLAEFKQKYADAIPG